MGEIRNGRLTVGEIAVEVITTRYTTRGGTRKTTKAEKKNIKLTVEEV
jgi:hypothetical protein